MPVKTLLLYPPKPDLVYLEHSKHAPLPSPHAAPCPVPSPHAAPLPSPHAAPRPQGCPCLR
eukprot:1149291-Pelagomonas_calceolata.AAC.1